LTLVLAESSIERIPPELTGHPSVVAHARRKQKEPCSIILDRSYHHSAMIQLECSKTSKTMSKRGRPDITFHFLLAGLGSPLNREGLLTVLVHTIDDHVIEIDASTRIPKNYDRFIGLLEQLYDQRSVPPGDHPLMRIRRSTISGLLEELKPSMTIVFSTLGKPSTLEDTSPLIASTDNPLVLIGGFAHSHFEESTIKLADYVFSIDRDALDAWIVAGRVIYEYERSIRLPERRLRSP